MGHWNIITWEKFVNFKKIAHSKFFFFLSLVKCFDEMLQMIQSSCLNHRFALQLSRGSDKSWAVLWSLAGDAKKKVKPLACTLKKPICKCSLELKICHYHFTKLCLVFRYPIKYDNFIFCIMLIFLLLLSWWFILEKMMQCLCIFYRAGSMPCTLQHALDLFLKKELIEYRCEKCGCCKAEVSHKFTRLPR